MFAVLFVQYSNANLNIVFSAARDLCLTLGKSTIFQHENKLSYIHIL